MSILTDLEAALEAKWEADHMSDRINELVDAVNKMTFTMADTWFDGSDVDASARFAAKDAVMETVTELATIAREAEARALTWQLTTENTQELLNEATTRAIEKEKKYREAIADRDKWIDRCYQSDERADKAESVCEWLAKQWKVACDSDELPCHICPFADKGAPATCQSAEAMLKAASEAVGGRGALRRPPLDNPNQK